MKIDVNDNGEIVLSDVFNGIGIRAEDGGTNKEGFEIGIAQRDSGFEVSVEDMDGKLHRIMIADSYITIPGRRPIFFSEIKP